MIYLLLRYYYYWSSSPFPHKYIYWIKIVHVGHMPHKKCVWRFYIGEEIRGSIMKINAIPMLFI